VEFKEVSKITTGDDYTFRRIELARAVLDADVVINLPKVKTHSQTLLTLGVKNIFGCIPGMRKAQWHLKAGTDHSYFSGMLTELCQIVNPALTIVDGITGMEGEGPNNGDPRPLGLILAGANPHALDATICQIIGVLPEELLTLQAAHERGFEGTDPQQIEVLGLQVEDVAVASFRLPARFDVQWNLPGFIKRPLKNIFTPKPIITRDLCKACGACAEACPPQAISLSDKKVEIDYHHCIRCYCCQEVCPEGAVRLQEGWVRRLAS
jgi:ferredoxin